MTQSLKLMVAGLLLISATIGAQPARPQAQPQGQEARPAAATDTPREEWSYTDRSIQVGGQTIPYKAAAGTTMLKNEAGEPIGLLYSVAYTRSDVKDLSTRPVSFVYNGGPGSATMWLHMGAFGPRRVHTVNGEFTPPAPYKLVDNNESLLDKTDLVFIDAMGTGYSRIAGKGTPRDFYGVDEDANAFAQFIATYISRNDRWNSPKFLLGESYGTFRSAAVGNLLQNRYNMHLNGINLISSVLDLATITFSAGDDRPYMLYLPSYAAVAWYHKALKNRPANLAAFIEEARKYAQTEYAEALFKGSTLTEAQRAVVAKKLSYFTGLSEDYLLKANLRPTLGQFNVELLRGRGLTSGRIDARFTGYTGNLLSETAQGDPEGPAVGGAYTALINMYNHDELKFGKDKTYNNRYSNSGGWNWTRGGGFGRGGGGFPSAPNTQSDLTQAMITNPKLLVQVENGYYDMATPFFATEYTMTHLGLPNELKKNIKLNYYESGHMMYLRDEDRVLLHNNVAEFIDRATNGVKP
ncbi:MAG: peptidase S10 [Acidobacteria bacterium]|nr:peptidase S10 [Acidobacteriota bacterium]